MSDWPIVTLKAAGVSLIDCDHKTPKAQDEGLPYIGIPQLKEGHVTLEGARLIAEGDFHHWRRKSKPTPHDVILSRRCNPGVTAYVPEGLNIALGQNLVLLRSDGEKMHPQFLRWVVQGPNWWNQIGKFINVGAVFESLKCVDIPKFGIKLPPMDAQIKISNILDALDNKIELNRQINQTLEQIAQAIFKSWFVDFEPVKAKAQVRASIAEGKMSGSDQNAPLPKDFDVEAAVERAAMCAISGKSLEELEQLSPEIQQQLKTTAVLFPDALVESELGEIPEGWRELPLYETAEYVNGAAFKSKDFSEDGSGLPIIKIAELKQGVYSGTKFTHSEVKQKYFVTDNDVLYSWSGSPETSLEVFKWFGGDGWLNQHIFKLNFETSEQKYFTYYLLKHMKPVLIATAKQKQTTGLGHVTVADMKRIKVPFPSDKVLSEFKRIVSEMYDECSFLEKENISLSNARDILLPKLLSGELEIGKVA